VIDSGPDSDHDFFERALRFVRHWPQQDTATGPGYIERLAGL
jgi:hypothetical protein